jgi:7-cyano-7-deazaguanine synthase in queuosine biosynthesis
MDAAANLCSGGLDSYLAWKLFVPEAENVFVRIGHAYQQRELGALASLRARDGAFRVTSVQGPSIGHLETPSGIIPCRNALLLLTAAAHVASRPGVTHCALHLGALDGEINSDKSPEFMAAVEDTLNVSWRRQYWTDGVQFRVTSPVRAHTKAGLIRLFADAGGDPAVLAGTLSCYAADDRDRAGHCGACPACFKRWVAFRVAGVPDRTDYGQAPGTSLAASRAREKALDGTYDPVRAEETLRALQGAV